MFPWHDIVMLAFESGIVIQRRLTKIARGDGASLNEIHLMFAEKADALVEMGTAVVSGGTLSAIVERYRVRVAANETRLST